MGNAQSNEQLCQDQLDIIHITPELRKRICEQVEADAEIATAKAEEEAAAKAEEEAARQKPPEPLVVPEIYNCYVENDKKKEIIEGLLPHGISQALEDGIQFYTDKIENQLNAPHQYMEKKEEVIHCYRENQSCSLNCEDTVNTFGNNMKRLKEKSHIN